MTPAAALAEAVRVAVLPSGGRLLAVLGVTEDLRQVLAGIAVGNLL